MNSLPKYILIGLSGLVIIAGLCFFLARNYSDKINKHEDYAINNTNPNDVKTNSLIIPKELDAKFSPLSSSEEPGFITNLKETEDVRVDFHYEGDYKSNNEDSYIENPYTLEGTDEHFISIPKVKNNVEELEYGPEDFEIFKSEGSHSYQGTPIYISNSKSNYSVSYVGFNINDKNLISSIRIEFGIDYLADFYDSKEKTMSSILNSVFGIKTANACGPGTYLKEIGDSNLTLVEETNGISWYRLDKPVAIYDLSLSYCDGPPPPSYCHNWAEDEPPECDRACYYNQSIPNLEKGNLRMHVLYKPNDQEGILRMQMANFILIDQSGQYYQAEMGENFDHYYRAYLH